MTRRPPAPAPVSPSLIVALLAAAAAAPAAAADVTSRDVHAARCVAALEVLTQDLATQVKAGDEPVRAVLMDRLVAAASFVGDAYLHGASDEGQAKAERQKALEAQKKLTPAELGARQAACAKEGAGLYAQANAVQQYVVRRFATRRMNKLLGPAADGASATAPRREP